MKNGQSEEMIEWLDTQDTAMLELTEKLVNIDSGSLNKPGVDAVATALEEFLDDPSITCERIPVEVQGDVLRVTVAGAASNQPIVLMGHRDTVFPAGEPQRRPFRVEGGRAYGPGVADMKCGVVMNAFILKAFAKFGGAPGPLIGLFNGDEEIGSPGSKEIIKETARGARAAFNLEPGRPSGNVVTSRKGGIFFKCSVTGKAAHSGAYYSDGISAIEELARKIQAWHALSDVERGVTVNVGTITGGQTVNTVAPHASCEIDTRYIKPEDHGWIMSHIAEVSETAFVEGTSSVLEVMGEFQSLNQTPESTELFDIYVDAAKASGLDLEGEFTGGCSDAGLTAGVGIPTICGLGPVGGHAHTPEEYLEIASFVPRAKALALTILRMAS